MTDAVDSGPPWVAREGARVLPGPVHRCLSTATGTLVKQTPRLRAAASRDTLALMALVGVQVSALTIGAPVLESG